MKKIYRVVVLTGTSYEVTLSARSEASARAKAERAVGRSISGQAARGDEVVIDSDARTQALEVDVLLGSPPCAMFAKGHRMSAKMKRRMKTIPTITENR